MATDHLSVYLNDHLAGSVVVLELLDHLRQAHAERDVAVFLGDLHARISADSDVLERVMDDLEVTRSPSRRAVAWISGKAALVGQPASGC